MRELKKKSAQTGIMTLIGLVAVSCGGGGGTSSPAISTSPPPPPAQSNNTFPATGGLCDGTAGWQAIADDNLDDSAAIQTSLQEVASKGDTLTIPPGTYNIDDPEGISVVIKNQDFSIVATDVIFVAGQNVNSDLIDFDATSQSFTDRCGGDDLVNISWTGLAQQPSGVQWPLLQTDYQSEARRAAQIRGPRWMLYPSKN